MFICHLYVFFGDISLGLLPTFWLDCLFFWYWAVCIIWRLILCQFFIWYYFFTFWRLPFHLAYSFLCCAKAFKFNQIPLVYFCFYLHYSKRWAIEDLDLIYVECSAYVSLWELSFYLFTVFFTVQKTLSLIRSHLLISVFISITLEGGLYQISLWLKSSSVLPMFSSKSFIVSGLTFRSLIYLSLSLCTMLGSVLI